MFLRILNTRQIKRTEKIGLQRKLVKIGGGSQEGGAGNGKGREDKFLVYPFLLTVL